MEIEVRSLGFGPVPPNRLVIHNQRVRGADFSGQRLAQFSSANSTFKKCRFDDSVIDSASFGGGLQTSTYTNCSFDGATLRMGPGGTARFVNCSFENVKIYNWWCFEVEMIGCAFSGMIRKAFFNGTVPPADRRHSKRVRNEFRGNDFSRARLLDVSFRTGIDLSQQRLPEGEEYTYLPDAAIALAQARRAMEGWTDPQARENASSLLRVLEEDVTEGQRQLLVRANDYAVSSRPAIRAMLLEAQLQA